MQVLRDSKVNLSQLLVLAFRFLSGSVFGLLTATGLIVFQLKKKTLLLTLNLSSGFCCSTWMLQGWAGVVLHLFVFPFPVVPQV